MGRWYVIGLSHRDANRKWFWNCRCACGVEKAVNGKHLNNGESTQCRGCAKRTHGGTVGRRKSTEYAIWASMVDRCCNPNNQRYADYGGRGITVCTEWRDSFEAFLHDMGHRPKGLTLDRRDNSLGYSKENCRWATWEQQANNRRPARR